MIAPPQPRLLRRLQPPYQRQTTFEGALADDDRARPRQGRRSVQRLTAAFGLDRAHSHFVLSAAILGDLAKRMSSAVACLTPIEVVLRDRRLCCLPNRRLTIVKALQALHALLRYVRIIQVIGRLRMYTISNSIPLLSRSEEPRIVEPVGGARWWGQVRPSCSQWVGLRGV